MHSTYLRQLHSHGAFLGTAVGESLGLARQGLTRQSAIRYYGPDPLRYQLLPGFGIYGENTKLGFLFIQSLLNSRNDFDGLKQAFRWRLSWYPLSLSCNLSNSTLRAGARSWLMRFGLRSGTKSTDSAFASRAIYSGVVMQGTGHRLLNWAEEATRLTHHSEIATNCARVYCTLSSFACMRPKAFEPLEALELACNYTTDSELKEKLQQLVPFLSAKRGPRAVAKHFGWRTKIPAHCVATTVMATYCFLRFPKDFEKAVSSAVLLGGETAVLGASVGGLVGAHIGNERLPENLTSALRGYPHGLPWMERLASRVAQWPHGADDLAIAPALSSAPLLQVASNILLWPASLYHGSRRWIARVQS
ncbi:MAG: ADP-ribosylglycohydrolase family protein [Planctomycetota bacterium]